jgi:hypothetical protein
MGTILDQYNIVLTGELVQLSHGCRHAEGMLNNDGTGTRGDFPRNVRRIKVIGRRVNIGVDWLRSRPLNSGWYGDTGKGLDDNFVAGFKAVGTQECVECCPTGGGEDDWTIFQNM